MRVMSKSTGCQMRDNVVCIFQKCHIVEIKGYITYVKRE